MNDHMIVTREFSELMADFIAAVVVAKPGQVVPIPNGTTEKQFRVAMEMIAEIKAQKPRWIYQQQADGIY